jgi:thiamine-monophosphate kinase
MVEHHESETPLGPGAEFDLIRGLSARWGTLARGLGDDAAILDVPAGGRLVASTDTSLEGVHFLRAWLSPREIGYRAVAAAMSDLAAMAATPLGVLIALTLPEELLAQASLLADGMGEAAEDVRCPIIGGDTTRGDRLSLTATVLGWAGVPVRRSGARPGQSLFVTGRLGGPGAALSAFRAGLTPRAEHRARFAHPTPRLAEARWLADRGATAMIDVSDGLTSDVGHLAAASGVSIDVWLDQLPRMDGVSELDAGTSGEEYELLCTAPESLDTAAFADALRLPLTKIGAVSEGSSVGTSFSLSGERVDPGTGYNHFSP